jgi:putative chitinase
MDFPKEFTFEEMTVSQTAARHGIDNIPKGDALDNLLVTAKAMQRIRRVLGDKPVIVSSGYRSPALNKKIGGSDTSAHTLGYAVDFTVPGFGTPLEVAKAIAEEDFIIRRVDQLIHEYDSWVHISFDPRARQQLLTINKSGTKTGLH